MNWGNIISSGASGAATGSSIAGGVGAFAGGFIGLLNGFVSGSHQDKAESILSDYNKRQEARTNELNNWLSENTGTNMATKAWNTAKDLTGTLTSQQSQSKAYSAEAAQRNTGINKSQAALSGFNTIGSNYSDEYNSNIESQTAAAYQQLSNEAEAKVTDYNNTSNADKQASTAKAQAESEKTLLTDIADTFTQDNFWNGGDSKDDKADTDYWAKRASLSGVSSAELADFKAALAEGMTNNEASSRLKSYINKPLNSSNAVGDSTKKANTVVFSDETLKNTDKSNDSTIAIIQLLDILPEITNPEEKQLALDFMEIWYEVQSK